MNFFLAVNNYGKETGRLEYDSIFDKTAEFGPRKLSDRK